MAVLDPKDSVVDFHSGFSGHAWLNKNIYVVRWADREMENPPKVGYRLKEGEEYQIRVRVKNDSDSIISRLGLEISVAYSGTGLRYEDSTQFPTDSALNIPPNSEYIVKSNTIYRPTGRGHQCLFAVLKYYIIAGQEPAQFVPPLNNKGVIKGKSRIVAQHNSNVYKISDKVSSLLFNYKVDASVDKVQMERLPLADNKDLLDVNGQPDLIQEAEEDPKFVIYIDGEDMPSEVFYPEDIKNLKEIDMSSYSGVGINVVVELPKTRKPNDGAIYQFKASDDSDGIAMVLAYE